jgi:hypothetical protein
MAAGRPIRRGGEKQGQHALCRDSKGRAHSRPYWRTSSVVRDQPPEGARAALNALVDAVHGRDQRCYRL